MKRLVSRVAQQRQADGLDQAEAPVPEEEGPPPSPDERLAMIEERLDGLESALEGLQDAVHREDVRRDELIRELQRQTDPAELTRSLERYSREKAL
jgi:hypothetical protein